MDLAQVVAIKAEYSGDARFERQCNGKVRHLSQREAKTQAKQMHKKYHKTFSVYPCHYCDGWHIGANRSPEAGRRRAGV